MTEVAPGLLAEAPLVGEGAEGDEEEQREHSCNMNHVEPIITVSMWSILPENTRSATTSCFLASEDGRAS